jgi:hypothetical protein
MQVGRMKQPSAIEASRHFLSVVWDEQAPSDAVLAAALDRLLAAYHDAPVTNPSDSKSEAPRQLGAEIRNELADRFPDYGYYPVADPAGKLDEPLMVGDAIDDLVDLTLDIRDVIWLADNVSAADAYWSFRLHFYHWGRHARELSLYLHARQW